MYGPPLIDGAYSNPPAPTTYTTVSALSLPPHRTLSSTSASLHAAPSSAASPPYYTPSLYSFPIAGYLPSSSSSSSSTSSSYPIGLPSSSPGLSLFSSPSSSPHSSHLSGRSTPPSVSNLQAVLDAAELSEQRDSQLGVEVAEKADASTSSTPQRTKRADRADGSGKRTNQRNTRSALSASAASLPHSLPATLPLPVPSPAVAPASLTEPVDRQSLIAAFAVPPSAFPSASSHRQWQQQRRQLFRSYVGAPLTDTDALLVSLLRRAGRVFASLGGGRTASGEKVEQHRVGRDLLLALFASELPLPLVSSLFDVSSSGVKRLLEHTSNGNELEPYISQAKQKRLAQSSSSPQSTSASSRPRNLICKRTGRPMRDENLFAQSFFQRPQLVHADISTVWHEYVRETTAARGDGGGESDGTEGRRPPLSRAHFFTLAPEERRRKRKEQSHENVACQHCGAVKHAKVEEAKEQPSGERKESERSTSSGTRAGHAADAPVVKRAKVGLRADSGVQQMQSVPPAAGRKKAGRPKRAVQKSSLTSEMKALLPILLAEQNALSTQSAVNCRPESTVTSNTE